MSLQQNCCKLNFLIKFALSICKFMIPEFDENGRLPAGIHVATLREFEERYLLNETRKELYEGLKKLIADFKKIECKVIYIDGSFVTSKVFPKDIDVCWGNIKMMYNDDYLHFVDSLFPVFFKFEYPRLEQHQFYNCDIFPAYLKEGKSKRYFIDFFQLDKGTNEKKGIIQINI